MTEAVRMSAAALERLQSELAELRGPRREQIRQMIFDARQMGSIVENGDYTAAKEEERLVEDRIDQLEQLLARAELLDSKGDGRVGPGSVVTLRFAGSGEEETYLFGETAERGDTPVCTPSSPLGRALSGATAGQTIEYRTPSGARVSVEIVAVG